jgi:hypothetical protein
MVSIFLRHGHSTARISTCWNEKSFSRMLIEYCHIMWTRMVHGIFKYGIVSLDITYKNKTSKVHLQRKLAIEPRFTLLNCNPLQAISLTPIPPFRMRKNIWDGWKLYFGGHKLEYRLASIDLNSKCSISRISNHGGQMPNLMAIICPSRVPTDI